MGPPGGARPGAREPLTYGARKQPHVRFPITRNVSEEAQRRTIRVLAETLGVDSAELVGE
jgi:creatinine amidohydrolase/Fe(II)-dependent formamide hydrolase-like protein